MIPSGLFGRIPSSQLKGDIIPLKTTQEKHTADMPKTETPESTSTNFATALNSALQKVNDQQINAEKLQQQLVAKPESVSAHEVMIATEKARMSLRFTKTMTDMATKTYRDLVNLR